MEELNRAFRVVLALIASRKSVSGVIVDGERVFSRAETARLPLPGEISRKLSPSGR